ncbi:hypothetical protein CEXT_674101 [Caerostris extrusa]|uniref:Uncharacterized protein n=1 Tax=Caerostris extrusa TaxID=172846 RepID=A0AAV4UU17_CAEEX|nr:hypothetical protein CEXT_674101 [Caerostris extrusa]
MFEKGLVPKRGGWDRIIYRQFSFEQKSIRARQTDSGLREVIKAACDQMHRLTRSSPFIGSFPEWLLNVVIMALQLKMKRNGDFFFFIEKLKYIQI